MPVQIDEMPKTTTRAEKYDFGGADIFDGAAYVLTRGSADEVAKGKADFSITVGSMRQTLYRMAERREVSLGTRLLEHEGREAVAVQVDHEQAA